MKSVVSAVCGSYLKHRASEEMLAAHSAERRARWNEPCRSYGLHLSAAKQRRLWWIRLSERWHIFLDWSHKKQVIVCTSVQCRNITFWEEPSRPDSVSFPSFFACVRLKSELWGQQLIIQSDQLLVRLDSLLTLFFCSSDICRWEKNQNAAVTV